REAAGAAAERLKAKLDEAARLDPPVEMKFSLPDEWSVRLFIALCRRYGVRPFRYARQRRTTIMVKAPRRFFDTVVWRQFSDLHTDLWIHFQQTRGHDRSFPQSYSKPKQDIYPIVVRAYDCTIFWSRKQKSQRFPCETRLRN